MKTRIVWIVSIAFSLICALCVFGCHTVEGAGRDIERGGEAIQDAVN